MEALCRLQPGERMRLIIGREPLPLYRVLDQNGYAYFTTVRDDGVFEIDIGLREDSAAGNDEADSVLR
jgi:uncharacterized protein (DUF2249 family)